MARKRMLVITVAVLAVLGFSSLATPANADPTAPTAVLSTTPNTVADARAQLDSLEQQQQNILTEQATAQDSLQAAQNQLASTQAQIATQQTQISQLQSQLAQIALQQYQSLGMDTTAMIMTSSSIDDMLNQMTVMQQVSNTAATLLTSLQLDQGTLAELQRSQQASLTTIQQQQTNLANLAGQLTSQIKQASTLLSTMTMVAAASAVSGGGGGDGGGLANPTAVVPNPSPSLADPLAHFTVTSPFGMRVDPVTRVYALHDGIDLASGCGDTVIAPANGYVVDYYVSGGYGNRLVLDNGMIGGHHIVTTFNHLMGTLVQPGTSVTQGQPIAKEGSTGQSTGCHVHYQVWVDGQLVNPAPYLSHS